ncbi:4'-phosphopantetheinyl transferase superfamily protein [Streptomyces sp. NBC_00102]|uniref:4'-phosphopantetheinyl transferase family protein n=1 Tax=Streptomyces sp. NBC_00102 TaxID=2975652 RepID=UPI00225801BE|nr:4'-phosphopantetheinyl transferase superfamily protein [Streptomyces sp. NBC_00102]MCX5400830.1 4'-phosphopantetheinyl transferase superfamily protein [Streptomyces sp. NBC_00102]
MVSTRAGVRPWSPGDPPPGPSVLDGGGPVLWSVRPWPQETPDPAAAGVLDEAERRQAAAFRRPEDREMYVASHTALRVLLGGVLELPPARVALVRLPCPGCGAAHGRPAVAGPAGERVHFSLSHTGGLALVALAARPVGVDVERTPSATTVADTATALHPLEQSELSALPVADRPAAFARCWTRKEAYLKGTGEGLSGSALSGAYLGTGPTPAPPPGGWTLADVPVPPGYVAACAVAVAEESGTVRDGAPLHGG